VTVVQHEVMLQVPDLAVKSCRSIPLKGTLLKWIMEERQVIRSLAGLLGLRTF
jgi:hypothetical protein